MIMIHWHVNTFINWYVPTVLYCNDKFVKTTNPQKANDNGTILRNGISLASNILKNKQIFSPRAVMIKWKQVNVMFGNLYEVNNILLSMIIKIDDEIFATIEKPIWNLEGVLCFSIFELLFLNNLFLRIYCFFGNSVNSSFCYTVFINFLSKQKYF